MPVTAENIIHMQHRFAGRESSADVTVKRGLDIFEGTDYPTDWSGFIGQPEAKEQLIVQARSAKARNTRIEHTLLASGIHGVGKTTLATLTAYDAGVGFVQTTGPLTVEDFMDLVKPMQDHDILFIDEAHRLTERSRNQADWLLPFMTEGVVYGKSGAEQVPNIAIVAATTDAGKLPETLLSRFMCTPDIVAYNRGEAGAIAYNLSTRMGVELPRVEHAEAIAEAADHNPRMMRRILTQVRDLEFVYPETHPNLPKAFKWAGVAPDGLTMVARDMLLVLLGAKEHTASIESIRAHLGEPGPIKAHEKQLLQRGLLDITGRGRCLTDEGVMRALDEVKTR